MKRFLQTLGVMAWVWYGLGSAPLWSQVVINEFLADPDSPWAPGVTNSLDSQNEWVELLNTGSSSVDLSGWWIDDLLGGGSSPYTFPQGSVLDAGAFWVVYGTEGLPGLNNTGDEIHLMNSNGVEQDAFTYTSSQVSPDVSLGRNPDGTGTFQAFSSPTPGKPNVDEPLVSILVLEMFLLWTIALGRKRRVRRNDRGAV